jgi:hypothetical protein
MEAAAILCAFLAPFVALIAGLALVTFSPLKRAYQPKKVLLIALFVGSMSAVGWAPLLMTSGIGLWIYLGVIATSSLYATAVICFVCTEVLIEKTMDEPRHRALRARYNYIF